MTEPSEAFRAWHAKRSAALIKSADELAVEYVKDGFSDSSVTRRTALLKVFETADGSGWDAWQAGREAALEEAAICAWSHFRDTCKANNIAPASSERWLVAGKIRSLK